MKIGRSGRSKDKRDRWEGAEIEDKNLHWYVSTYTKSFPIWVSSGNRLSIKLTVVVSTPLSLAILFGKP